MAQGRVLFRNRRIVLDTFPQRIAHLCPLDATTDAHNAFETKVDWLVELMKSRPDEKILLITHLRETVEAIEEALRERISAQATVFHEGLSLLKRDKNAAWFADEEMGARIMLCSEIGSEGRNFQFAHHLVLFDLPGDPGLLEQRIGRLDRIGQNDDIHIHIPIIEGEPEEMLALWYHNGLGAFENTLHGSGPIYREFGEKIASLAEASADRRERSYVTASRRDERVQR
jgi:ATP-dependent helicase HepA